MLHKVLEHFRKAYAASPHNTSATFVVPAWLDQSFWKKLRGFKVVAVYAEGTELFSAPPAGYPTRTKKPRRVLGPTRWLTLVVHCPSLCRPVRDSKGAEGVGSKGGNDGGHAGHAVLADLPTLSGDRYRDSDLLREVPVVAVPDLCGV